MNGNERLGRWNQRYTERKGFHDFVASPPLPLGIAGVPPGKALDLACGAGRHAIFLAEHGFVVDAVDGSEVGLAVMMQEATQRGLADRITPRLVDLEREPLFEIQKQSYDLICDFYYLYRPLLPVMFAGVRPGGRLVFAIHLVDEGAAPMNPDFLLMPGELPRLVKEAGFEVIHLTEGASRDHGHERGTVELVAVAPLSSTNS